MKNIRRHSTRTRSFFKFVGIASFIGLVSLILIIVYKSDLIISGTTNKDTNKTVEKVAEVFKNEHTYINTNKEDDACLNYANNLEFYKGEIEKVLKNSSETATFAYYDINTGYTYGYLDDKEMFAASTIKAPLAMYIYTLASKGETSLSKKLTYTSGFYNDGSGIIKDKKVGTSYTIEELVNYSIIYSDNIAYLMLLDEYNYKNVRQFWLNEGATTPYANNQYWGKINAKDGILYMKYLYRFAKENNDYGKPLLNIFKAAHFKYFYTSDFSKIEIAHKSGFTEESANDLSIVFDKNPFIVTVLTKRNGVNGSDYFFNDLAKATYNFHKFYWENISCKY